LFIIVYKNNFYMEKSNWFSQFIQRLTTDTPAFFKRIIAFGISVGVVGAGLIALPDSVIKAIPLDIHAIGGYMLAIGAVAGVIAKSATTDKSLQKEGGSNPPK
jgi:hypothetical protein